MKKVSCEEDHVDISFFGQAHDFMEAFPAVVASDWVALIVANMIVCGD